AASAGFEARPFRAIAEEHEFGATTLREDAEAVDHHVPALLAGEAPRADEQQRVAIVAEVLGAVRRIRSARMEHVRIDAERNLRDARDPSSAELRRLVAAR